MVIRFISSLIKDYISKYIIYSILGIIASYVFYYVVKTHFERKMALRTAISYQEKQDNLIRESHIISNKFDVYKNKIYHKKINCDKECTPEDFKNALIDINN